MNSITERKIKMEGLRLSVLISNSNGIEKSFEEGHDGSLKSLMVALKNIKAKTNEYLTEIVDEEKRNKNQGLEYVEKGNSEDSDVEIEDDYIDSKIKKELSEQSSANNVNKSGKRTKSFKRNNKKAKY